MKNDSTQYEVWREWKNEPWERFIYCVVEPGEILGNGYEKSASLYGTYKSRVEALIAISKAE